MDRREIVKVFRERLEEVIRRSGDNRSAFAARIGLDRSTLSQLLAADQVRLPRAETVAAIARNAQVSVDWLLGLSQEGQLSADMLAQALEIEPGGDTSADECLRRWHLEAVGYKIRYVPSTLPDLLKSEEVIRYESGREGSRAPKVRIEEAEERLAYSRRPETDMEACSPVQSIEGFARGEGIWRQLPPEVRRAQLDQMIRTVNELYPTFRWFLYDGLERHCVPLTIFGPLRAAVYIGQMYLVLNSTEHIRMLTRRFDKLIRAAVVQPPDVAGLLDSLRREL
jgi:transcriptional regulator with XRE-family HTH domain